MLVRGLLCRWLSITEWGMHITTQGSEMTYTVSSGTLNSTIPYHAHDNAHLKTSFSSGICLLSLMSTLPILPVWSTPNSPVPFFVRPGLILYIFLLAKCNCCCVHSRTTCVIVSLGSWIICLTLLGASVTNLNEPPSYLHYNVG